jgi:hypothetical protein
MALRCSASDVNEHSLIEWGNSRWSPVLLKLSMTQPLNVKHFDPLDIHGADPDLQSYITFHVTQTKK